MGFPRGKGWMLGLSLPLIGMLVGCMCPQHIVKMDAKGEDADLVRTSYRAVDCLIELTPDKVKINPDRRVLVATAVELDHLYSTSTLGRLLGEFAAARLSQQGYSVVHLTVRQGSVAINDDGQFFLSRDIQKLAANYDTGSVLVTTYTVTPTQVFVSMKLVNAEANTIVSAIDFALPKGPETVALLHGGGAGGGGGSMAQRDALFPGR